jgi:hypothetical protein
MLCPLLVSEFADEADLGGAAGIEAVSGDPEPDSITRICEVPKKILPFSSLGLRHHFDRLAHKTGEVASIEVLPRRGIDNCSEAMIIFDAGKM